MLRWSAYPLADFELDLLRTAWPEGSYETATQLQGPGRWLGDEQSTTEMSARMRSTEVSSPEEAASQRISFSRLVNPLPRIWSAVPAEFRHYRPRGRALDIPATRAEHPGSGVSTWETRNGVEVGASALGISILRRPSDGAPECAEQAAEPGALL